MRLKNVTYREFLKVDPEFRRVYFMILKNVEGASVLETEFGSRTARDLKNLKYSQIDALRSEFHLNIAQGFWWIWGIDENQLMCLSIKSFYQGLNFMLDEILNLTELEAGLQELVEMSEEMEKRKEYMDTSELDALGHFNIMDQLATEWSCTPEDVFEKSWLVIYAKRKRNILLQNIQVREMEWNRGHDKSN